MPAIGELAQWDPEQGVKHAKRRAVEESDLVIAQAKIGLDVFSEDRNDVPVDEIQDINDNQDTQRIPTVRRDRPIRLLRRVIHLSVQGMLPRLL